MSVFDHLHETPSGAGTRAAPPQPRLSDLWEWARDDDFAGESANEAKPDSADSADSPDSPDSLSAIACAHPALNRRDRRILAKLGARLEPEKPRPGFRSPDAMG